MSTAIVERWIRVNREHPCPVCQKPDWCAHGKFGTNCMRIANTRPLANGGWFHPHGDEKPVLPQPKPENRPSVNCTALLRDWSSRTKKEWLDRFGAELGVSLESLQALGCAWAFPHQAWAFPMRDGHGDIVGIRLRKPDGHKFAVTGSRQGIFIPNIPPQPLAYAVEGPTDCAAALTIGLFAFGRPSCSGGNDQLKTALRKHGIARLVIISDNDKPGLDGAARLQDDLKLNSCIFVPPSKDIRAFVNNGGTTALINSMVKSLVWKSYPTH